MKRSDLGQEELAHRGSLHEVTRQGCRLAQPSPEEARSPSPAPAPAPAWQLKRVPQAFTILHSQREEKQ